MPKKNLTVKAVEAIKPPKAGQVDWWDTTLTGFVLRAQPSVMTWLVVYRSPTLTNPTTGKPVQRRHKLGKYPAVKVGDARELARKALNEVAEGRDPAEQKAADKASVSFSQLCTEYLERHAKVKKRSWKKDDGVIKRELAPRFKQKKAKAVTRAEIIAMLDEIRKRAPIRANRVLEIVRKIFNWGVSVDLVAASPCVEIPKPAPENMRERVLSDDEIRKFWAATEKESWQMRGIFRLRLITIQRGIEVATMRKADRDGRWWTVPSSVSKNKKPHRVWLSDTALDIIEDAEKRAGDSPWVFPSVRLNKKGEEGPVVHLGKPAKNIRHNMTDRKEGEKPGRQDVPDIRPHDLRRTGSTRMTGELKIPRAIVGKVLNHTDRDAPKATAHYDVYQYDAEKQEALERWAEHLTAILENKKPPSSVTVLRRKVVA